MLKIKIIAILTLILTGCGGGGGGSSSNGGGGGGGVTKVPFSSWDNIQPNSTVVADGTGTYASWGGNGGTVTSLSGLTTTPATWEGTYGSAGELVALTVDVGNGSSKVTFDKRQGDTLGLITNGPLTGYASVAIKADGSAIGIAAEPAPVGWKYQTYGVWLTGITRNSGTVAAATIGNKTSAPNLPSTGKAIFTGNAGGFYLDPQGNVYLTAADLVAVADLGTRSITVSTLNTSRSSDFQTFVASPQLDLSGRATIDSQNSFQFSGLLASRSGMTGNVFGSFYGPTATEIGGTYAVRGTGVESMIGGFGGRSDPIVSFTSWQNIPLNTVIQAQGISTQASYTGTTSSTTSISNFSTSTYIPATYNAVYDSNGSPSLVLLQSGEINPTNVAFNTNFGDTISTATVGPAAGLVGFATKADGTAAAIAAEPIPQGWSYQTYGVWATGYTQLGGGTFGSLSVGSETALASVPSTGTANFIGTSGGIYNTPAGNANFVVADMNANVNFSTRQIALSTTNTNVASNNFTTFTPNNQLNLNGTLQIISGENRFSGSVATPGNVMTGNATGQFYGPTASEIGGTYGVKGSGLESMVGGFGGKR